jgi:primosomal protein N' (replication factor Y)
MAHEHLVEVALNLPLHRSFTYNLPPACAGSARIGMRVTIPFGKKTATGYVVGFPQTAPREELKDVEDLLDEEPLFGKDDLQFYQWIADYYYCPLGQIIAAALPQGVNTSYHRLFSITAAGRAALREEAAAGVSRLILEALSAAEETPIKKLEKTIGRRGLSSSLSLLQKKGFIHLEEKKARAGTRVKKECWFTAADFNGSGLLKKKQHAIYQFLMETGASPLGAIAAHVKNPGAAIKALLAKGAVQRSEREVLRRPVPVEEIMPEPVHILTAEQKEILSKLQKELAEKAFSPFLLYGVTGSGKTEVYLRVMEEVLAQGRQCLLLVPEIALTTQLWDRVCSRIEGSVSMLHSSLSSAERFDAWRMIRRGETQIVIGARSAIFASFKDLGAIIVDEEHDPSYKQDSAPRYSARDLALIKGRFSKALVILGSATPSLESYHNVQIKKYQLGLLPRRIEGRKLPPITIVDMRLGRDARGAGQSIISPQLKEAIARRLQRGEQSLLFLNRRGFAPAYLCQQCGYTFRCPNCDVSLIHHLRDKKLRCHYCDLSVPLPESCPQCRSFFLTPLGWGTERLEKEMGILFPAARTARMDRDTTAAKGATRTLLKRIIKGELDILIGTQMVAKGHHLPQVTLVGVVCADHSLNFPDYRAGERTFQLLTQVAGRAGRGSVPGEVYIQTYNPEHYSILCAQEHDYQKFFSAEMEHRRELGYPPCTRMINFRLEGNSQERLIKYARELGNAAEQLRSQGRLTAAVEILGPAAAPWGKMKGKYRFQMVLKSSHMQSVRLLASRILNHAQSHLKASGISLSVDVDPVFIL